MRILHVFRGPIGGLFRHVCDLVRGQNELGHEVGIFCDSSTGGANAEAALAKIAPLCKLGIVRAPMATKPRLDDIARVREVRKFIREENIDVVHGHGAKGGLYARLAAIGSGKATVYTPHGGSLHYTWLAIPGFFYLATEWSLLHFTSGLAFVCNYEKNLYEQKFGFARAKINMIHNGLWQDEFKPIAPAKNASDILFVGELCHRKGVDLLLNAVAALKSTKKLSVALVGDGPETQDYKDLTKTLDLTDQVHFLGRLNIAKALPLGKLFVLPSRAEAFPYVVIEAIAAGKPTIATKVAGLVEVLPEVLLYQTENVTALRDKLLDYFDNQLKYSKITEKVSLAAPQKFSAETMVRSVTDFYKKLT
jgi:glycosyltransferase involved in cell wall biosynthesis